MAANRVSMTPTDLSTQTVLRILLQDQAQRLDSLRAEAEVLLERSRHTVSWQAWQGPVRELYVRTVHQLTVEVATVVSALAEAATASARGIQTLERGEG